MALDPSRYYIGDVGDNSTVIQGGPISVGFSAEEVLELVKTAVTGVTQLHVARIEELSTRLGITQAAVTTMLCMLGHDNVAVEQLPAALAAHAAQVLAMRTALSGALPHENSETAGLRRNALALLDAGDFVEAISQLENLCAREQTISRGSTIRMDRSIALRSPNTCPVDTRCTTTEQLPRGS
jgi:hypothetical protein